ncbi:SMODS domain-containing nucleotidyltransferase [Gluconobacter kondonii]|uniref:SMODS domain-containing nucleotidyltransferase n=1 Tax=Gluconobacter kondonii TaxID=941463 RepID=UPI001B8C7F0D|nr:nucleotidyltransferase [Gluconobacter kondonii]MBS1084533.1 hypothetical protein [Gluconobacter kondonii]
MSISSLFREFRENISVDNSSNISSKYEEITCALNGKFRNSSSKTDNSLQVGSYGRHTAIKGISDLDMLYILPSNKWEEYKNGGQYKLLRECRDAILYRYPRTTISVDRLVVTVTYKNFHVEVQPVFEKTDGSFFYPDTYNGGSWKTTKPREEIKAMKDFDGEKNKNFRRLCKMVRAWKNKHGIPMGGLLIDTLVHNFFKGTNNYNDTSYSNYHLMSRDFFLFLSELPKNDKFHAIGSNQHVKVKKNFQKYARNAYELCLSAIKANDDETISRRWKKIYGKNFPSVGIVKSSIESIQENGFTYTNTEQFFEDLFPEDIRYNIEIDCLIEQNGFRNDSLSNILFSRRRLGRNKKLIFYIKSNDIEGDFQIYWKIKNVGIEAIKRDCVRGQIIKDTGKNQKIETTDFYGDHIAECAAVQNGVVVAKTSIEVPIDI